MLSRLTGLILAKTKKNKFDSILSKKIYTYLNNRNKFK